MCAQHDGVNKLLQQGVEALRSGDRARARGLLVRLVRLDQQNEQGWHCLAWAVDTEEERRKCLERVLAINPNNTQAKISLNQLVVRQIEKRIEKLKQEEARQQNVVEQKDREVSKLHTSHAQLDDRVTALEIQRKQEEQLLSQLRAERGQLETQIAEKKHEVDNIQNLLASLDADVKQRQERFAQLQQKVDGLQGKVHQRETALAELEATQTERERLVAEREQQATALHNQLKSLESETNQRREAVTQIEQKVEALQGEIRQQEAVLAELKTAQSEHESLIAERERRASEMRGRLESLEVEERQHQDALAQLQQKAETLQSEVHQQEAALIELEATQTERERLVAEREQQATALHNQLKSLEAETNQRREAVAQLEQKDEALQGEIRQRENTLAELEAAQAEHKSAIAEQEQRTGELQDQLKRLVAKVEQHRETVAQLEQSAGVLQHEVEQRETAIAELETVKTEQERRIAERERRAAELQADVRQYQEFLPQLQREAEALQDSVAQPEATIPDPKTVEVEQRPLAKTPDAPAHLPLEILVLSVRAYNALKRWGIDTVGQLSRMSSVQLLEVRNVGQKSAAEIRAKLKDYLSHHPLPEESLESSPAPLEPSMPSAHEPAVPDEPEPSPPLVDQALLARAALASLDDIAVERLVLSGRWRDQLRDRGITSIGELTRQSSDVFGPDSPVVTQLRRYLNWLVGQDEATWADEATGRVISPAYRLLLAETTLDELMEHWLGVLDERDRQVLKWRYGLDDERLTLDEIGRRLGVSRERVRQLQLRAHRRLSAPRPQSQIWLLVELLRHTFIEAGGLMTEFEMMGLIAEFVCAEAYDAEWTGRLILHVFDEFEEVVKDRLWGFASASLHLVDRINQEAVELLEEEGAPLPAAHVLNALKIRAIDLDHERQDDLDDGFIAACLRTNRDVESADDHYALAAWTQEQADDRGLELRDGDEPTYRVGEGDEQQTDESRGQGELSEQGMQKPEDVLAEPQWRVDFSGPPVTLADWETYLRPWVRRVELLGEIPISSDERIQLGAAIGRLVRSERRSRALHALHHSYRAAFGVFLVAQGVYGYDGRGGYWPGVGDVIDKPLNPSWIGELGRLFEKIIEDFDLPFFPDLGGRRFVDLILAHSGIPDYCLPDFFENMLQRSVTQIYFADMSAAELIEEWLWRGSGRYITDKPVLRFLEFGGEVAEDFVARCREMAWEYLEAGIVPEAEDVGLPERVVGAYGAWIVEQGAEAMEREAADRWRLRKPRILVDPWGEGVLLDLPPQQVPATEVYADVAWQMMADEKTYPPLHVRVRRTSFDLKTESESFPLDRPARVYKVSLQVDEEVKHTWRFPGVSDERPLLVFDPERFTLLSWQHSLPARRLGLLYPARLDLDIEGEPDLVEDLPRFPWGWADSRGQTWDLSQATEIVLSEDEETLLRIAVRPDKAAQQPQLVGGQLLAPEASGERAPVYIGAPPRVRIPLVGRAGLEEELARWRVTVRSKWTAIPERQVTVSLADLRSEMDVNAGTVDLPLSLPSLLGDSPCGNFMVRVRGPLGRDAEFTLRIVPHLVICGVDDLYLPGPQHGPQSVMLLVEVGPDARLECGEEDEECRVRLTESYEDRREYEVEVGPETTAVELTVVQSLPPGDPVRVPVLTSIRRLRWALTDAAVAGRREWSGRPIRLPVEALLQSESPHLLVTLPLSGDEQATLTLGLLDIDGDELQVVDSISLSKNRRLWRFDLSAFLDTIRQADRSPILRFELGVWSLPGREEPIHLPVLSLTQQLIVDDVALQARRVDGCAVFELTWHEPTPLRSRHVRLWPLWRPWNSFLEQSIPDDVEGVWTFEPEEKEKRDSVNAGGTAAKAVETGLAYSGKYRVEFLVVDLWAPPATPKRPPADAPSTADVALVPPRERLRFLDDRIQEDGPNFELFLERAFIYTDVGSLEKARGDWQWCFSHLDAGTIPQVLALVDLVASTDDQASLTGLQLKMFASARVERLLRDRERGDVPTEHFRCYLDNLPRSSLLHKMTCRLLLSVNDDTVRLHAVQQLIRRKDSSGIDAVLAWTDAATLSDADAVALLNLNAEFSADYLERRLDNPVALRLMEALSLELGNRAPVVRVGTWAYTDAGWGRVERIENLDGQVVEQFISGERDYRLYVTLRPALDAMPIVVDLTKKLITFPEADCIYTCTKCNGFSSRNLYLIVERHDEVAHSGCGPSYRKEQVTVRSLQKLVYSARPPGDAGLGL